MKRIIALLTLTSVFAGCDRPASEPEAAASTPEPAAVVEAEVSIYAAAVASETRPEADRARKHSGSQIRRRSTHDAAC